MKCLLKLSLYQRLAISLSFTFIVIAYLLFWWSNSLAEHTRHHTEQQLHINLAQHLAQDNPLLADGVYDKAALKNLFHTLMLLGPAFEFYFIDPQGEILTYSADANKIKRTHVDLSPLQQLITTSTNLPVYGDDPRHKQRQKIFSAAPIYAQHNNTNNKVNTPTKTLQGYLYVIIGGEIYDSIFSHLKKNQQIQQYAITVITALLLLLLLLLVLFNYFTAPIKKLAAQLIQIKSHNFNINKITLTPWPNNTHNEIYQLGNSCNAMVEQIHQQLQQLTQNDQNRKELLSHLSHDLRTPLSAIQGYIEILTATTPQLSDHKKAHYINIIYRNSEQLQLLVDQIFELAHLESGQTSVNLENFPIGELIIDIIDKFNLKAQAKKITLTLTPQPCDFSTHTDIAKLERIISNLIDNALRHTPNNGNITINIEKHLEQLKVTVSDTGSGIDKKELKKIFTARYRATNSKEDSTQHIGLGLTISMQLCLLLHTELKVISELGHGSQFYFYLPTTKCTARSL